MTRAQRLREADSKFCLAKSDQGLRCCDLRGHDGEHCAMFETSQIEEVRVEAARLADDELVKEED